MKALEDFVETLDSKFKILQREIYYIIEDVKREEFLSDPAYLETCNMI